MNDLTSLNSDDLASVVEAALLCAPEGISAAKLSDLLDAETDVVVNALNRLKDEYISCNRGFFLRSVAGKWQLYTNPAHYRVLANFISNYGKRRLSQAAYETLAVVAYFQPVTRDTVREIRGVNSDSVLNSLKEKELIVESSYKADGSNALYFETSSTFLERFGLNSVSELPPLENFAADERTRKIIEDRLTNIGKNDAGYE